MKQKSYISLTLVALASCTSEYFTGAGTGDGDCVQTQKSPVAQADDTLEAPILIEGIGANAAPATRVSGTEAANLLGGAFKVFATNDGGVVFNNYQVIWKDNAGSTSTNKYGWEYIGYMSKTNAPVLQNVKYWDESANRYDFVAFSGLTDEQQIASVGENTYEIDASNMHTVFFANRVSAKAEHVPAVPGVSPDFLPYGAPVKFMFRRATARIRVGFYETIHGYAVKDLRFYYGDTFDAPHGTSTQATVALEGCYPESGNYTIYYDIDNVAHMRLAPSATTTTHRPFGTLAYDQGYLGTTSATATYAVCDETLDGALIKNSVWHPILPFEDNESPLDLRADYTLVSIDGSGEKIHVTGAKATVPSSLCRWKPNYSYTYIFKISSNTGYTGSEAEPAGLYPITFDATVSSVQEDVKHEENL